MGRYNTEKLFSAQSTSFKKYNKPVVGIDLYGTILDGLEGESTTNPIPGSLQAVALIRSKGYRIVIFGEFPGIVKHQQTTQQADSVVSTLMRMLGEAGCETIDGIYYSTSNLKDDIYAKPNNGMFKRAEEEAKVNWKEGWYVGDGIEDLKCAEKIRSKPILVKTGKGQETIKKLETFSNRELKKSTKVFENLMEFAQSLN